MRWRQVHAVWDFQCSNQRTPPLSSIILRCFCSFFSSAASQAISEVLSICPFIQLLTNANRACKYSHEFVLFYSFTLASIPCLLYPFFFKNQTSMSADVNAGSDIVWSKSALGKHTPSLTTYLYSHILRFELDFERGPEDSESLFLFYCLLSYLRGIGVVLMPVHREVPY